MWPECVHNGQSQVRETTRGIWGKTTSRTLPDMTTDLIRGITALSFKDDLTRDLLCILVSMTIWAIWKSRNENTLQDQVVTPNETRETLKEMIRDISRKSWSSMRLMEGRGKFTRQRAIEAMGGGAIRRFQPENGSNRRSHLRRDVAGVGGF